MNNTGSMNMISLILMLSVIALALNSFLQDLNFISNIRNTNKALLCLKQQVVENKNYVSRISSLNKALRILYTLSLVSPPNIKAAIKASIKVITITQDLVHKKILLDITRSNHCSLINKIIWKSSLPYKSNIIKLQRSINKTTIVRDSNFSKIVKFEDKVQLFKVDYKLSDQYSKLIIGKILWPTKYYYGHGLFTQQFRHIQ